MVYPPSREPNPHYVIVGTFRCELWVEQLEQEFCEQVLQTWAGGTNLEPVGYESTMVILL